MKKQLLIASLTLIGSLGVCYTASAAISASKHDFSGTSWTGGQICVPCHAPHNNKNDAGELLWNHTNSTATYQLYSSPTFDANGAGAANTLTFNPAGVSKFCLSCHDGTVAKDAYGSHTAAAGFVTGSSNLGTNLGNDHPVSFPYDAALATTDGFLTAPSALPTSFRLFDGKMECSSCHDVHNKYSVPGLLNASNAGSALCLTCHKK
jgi:predicted CXXCH cytochrome family protein